MTKRQWTYFALLATILAASIAALDLWIQPNPGAITGHFGYLCALMLAVRLALRYGQRWRRIDAFNAALGAAILAGFSIVLWRVGDRGVAAFDALAALVFALGIFVELNRLKHAPVEQKEEKPPEPAAAVSAAPSGAPGGAGSELSKLAGAIAAGAALYLVGTGLLVFHAPGGRSFLWTFAPFMATMLGPLLPLAACAGSRRWWKYHMVAGMFGVSLIFVELLVLDRNHLTKWDFGFAAVVLLLGAKGLWEVLKVSRREDGSSPSSAPQGTARP